MPYESIPAELKSLRRWLCWKIVERDGKPTKIPVQVNGQPADVTDPKTWTAFEAACAGLIAPKLNGVGFVFAKDDGYTGIDLDRCRNPQTGVTEDWARKVILELDSYTELSQSGGGWHVIIRGNLPGPGSRKGRVEMYDNARFFCMTGERAKECPATIEPRDPASLQQRMLAGELAPPAPRVASVVDESAEDWRLLHELQKQSGAATADALEDALRIQVPERMAERNRSKGTRGGKTYFRYTIEKFLAENPVVDDEPKDLVEPWPEFPRLPGTLGAVVDALSPDLPYGHRALTVIAVVGLKLSGRVYLSSEPFLQPRFYTCLIGPPGTGKSSAVKEVLRALAALGLHYEYSIDSGPALVQAFDEERKILYSPDELADGFEKAKQTSNGRNSLFGEFLQLYEGNVTARRVVKRKGEGGLIKIIDAHLAIVGTSTKERFDRMWTGTAGALGGLQSRFVVSYSETPLPPLKSPGDAEALRATVLTLQAALVPPRKVDEDEIGLDDRRGLTLTEEAQIEILGWQCFKDLAGTPRALDMAKRFALVLAASSGACAVDGPTMLLGLDFADYQIAIAPRLMPEDASGYVQAFENRILRAVEKHGRLTERQMRRFILPQRYPGGHVAFQQACRSLVVTGALVKVGAGRTGKPIYSLD